jgi:hypothetical protein
MPTKQGEISGEKKGWRGEGGEEGSENAKDFSRLRVI